MCILIHIATKSDRAQWSSTTFWRLLKELPICDRRERHHELDLNSTLITSVHEFTTVDLTVLHMGALERCAYAVSTRIRAVNNE